MSVKWATDLLRVLKWVRILDLSASFHIKIARLSKRLYLYKVIDSIFMKWLNLSVRSVWRREQQQEQQKQEKQEQQRREI